MNRLAKFLVRHSKLALFGFISLIMLSSIWGFQSFGYLKGGGYDDPGSDSAKVSKILSEEFAQDSAEVVIVADFNSAADDPVSAAAGKSLSSDLAKVAGVDKVESYYSLGSPAGLRSDDGNAAYFFVYLDEDAKHSSVAKQISTDFTGDYLGKAKIYVAGYAAITASINASIEHDLALAESIAIPLTLVLLVFVFGSLVAAGLPMMIGGLSIVGSFFFIWLSAQFTDTSIFALNLITGMGLGLGIDYALLMVNRFREERARGLSVDHAVIKTVETAGRTVLFSGITVAIVLGSLFFFPQYFLKSFGLGGFVVVVLAVAGALIALPANLKLAGDGINKLRILKRDLTPKEAGGWGAIARFVMKRPVAVLLVTSIGLGGLVYLAKDVQFGQVDDRVLRQSDPAVVASNVIRERFSAREGSPVEIIMTGASQDDVTDYVLALSKLDNVVRVQSTSGIAIDGVLDDGYAQAFANYAKDEHQKIIAIHDIESRSSEGIELTEAIRNLDADHEILVGGSAAIYTDSQAGIEKQLPLVGGWIIIWTLILLFLFTGSVLLPIKAVLLNIMSLGATLGFLTWVFMEGNLKWLIGDFYVTGSVDTSSIVLIAVIAFGLSMDYELFLLSRIKDQHLAGLGTTESVAVGLQKSGRIITAAALVLAVSFLFFITSGVTIMKMMGLGIAFAILLDATVVRALLVPALMRLFGEANWWAPKWLRKIYRAAKLDH
jgi:RND superfamily putative drug exporter